MRAFLLLTLCWLSALTVQAQKIEFDASGNLYMKSYFEVPNDTSLDYMHLMKDALTVDGQVYQNTRWRYRRVASKGQVILKLNQFEFDADWEGKLIFKLDMALQDYNPPDAEFGAAVNRYEWEAYNFKLFLTNSARRYETIRYRKMSEAERRVMQALGREAVTYYIDLIQSRIYAEISGRPACCQD